MSDSTAFGKKVAPPPLGAKGVLLCALVAPLVLLARLLRPLVLLRVGPIRNHTIGTTALHAETYMCDRELGHFHPKNAVDLFFHTEPRANREFDRVLETRLRVTPLGRYMQAVSAKLPGHETHTVHIGTAERDRLRDHYEAFTRTGRHFFLTDRQRREARRILEDRLGLPEGANWVCFFSRSSSYLRHLHRGGQVRKPGTTPTDNFRDSDISTYLPAAEYLCEQGYYAFRMGAVVDERIACRHPRMIDYANDFRSELLDLYLISECALILSDTTGLSDLCLMFRRPRATANIVIPQIMKSWDGLFALKRFWKRSEGRTMSMREVIETGGGNLTSDLWQDYAQRNDVELLDSTPEEILDLGREMHLRQRGEWQDDERDEAMQRRFWQAFEGAEMGFGGPPMGRIATTFLRRHPDLVGFQPAGTDASVGRNRGG